MWLFGKWLVKQRKTHCKWCPMWEHTFPQKDEKVFKEKCSVIEKLRQMWLPSPIVSPVCHATEMGLSTNGRGLNCQHDMS